MTSSPQTMARDELDHLMMVAKLRRPSPVRGHDGRWQRDPAGEWDWFYELPKLDREYISAHHFADVGIGMSDLAELMGADIAEAEKRFLQLARVARRRFIDAESRDDYQPEILTWSDIVGPGEVAELLGVKVQTVAMWQLRKVLPMPSRVISRIPLWSRSEILDWAAETGRLVAG